ncbi:uncharacterized protein LOC141763652 [Sebastes fasciatus]|uniref:uncharacterized protein LOC141763652 n=1 Tax=Sebastes fasciatus TaxID=394691 RepID=UPI003D9DB5D0
MWHEGDEGGTPPGDGALRGQYLRLNAHTPVVRLYLGEGDLKKDFRLSRQTINALVECLGYAKDHGWGKDLEVALYLYWLASATSYRVVSEAFDVPITTVHDVVHRVAGSIMAIFKRVVYFPAADELVGIGEGFARLAGSHAFRLPGSVHDARVLRWSSIYVEQLYPSPGWCIIGDGGYPCLAAPISLMTPYREPVQGPVQGRYNRHHSKARCVVERAIGMMKTQWRSIFLKALEVKSTFVPEVVSTCAFLHNLSIRNGDLVEPDVD